VLCYFRPFFFRFALLIFAACVFDMPARRNASYCLGCLIERYFFPGMGPASHRTGPEGRTLRTRLERVPHHPLLAQSGPIPAAREASSVRVRLQRQQRPISRPYRSAAASGSAAIFARMVRAAAPLIG
jgi:hypothetical protein